MEAQSRPAASSLSGGYPPGTFLTTYPLSASCSMPLMSTRPKACMPVPCRAGQLRRRHGIPPSVCCKYDRGLESERPWPHTTNWPLVDCVRSQALLSKTGFTNHQFEQISGISGAQDSQGPAPTDGVQMGSPGHWPLDPSFEGNDVIPLSMIVFPFSTCPSTALITATGQV